MMVRFLRVRSLIGICLAGIQARSSHRHVLSFIAALCLFQLQGCSTPERLNAVPKDEQALAVVDGMTGIRYWQKEDLALMQQDGLEAYKREADLAAAAGHKGPLPPANYLAVSGG